MNGNIEAVKKHLAAGVDVNATSKMWSGMTPLHIAAEGGHNEIAELLIAKGANVNAKTNDGETPLDKAVHHGQTEITGLLRKHSGKSGAEDSVHVAALVGNIEAVKQHLATGTDVNAKADDEWTPLHEAAWHGHKEIVELLIAKGADVKVKDGDGETPLDVATHPDNPNKNKAETANLLRKHGGKTGEELKAESK
jgi:cytohesin